MRRVLVLMSLAVSAVAADYHLELAPESTKINWTLVDVLHTVHGTFRLKRGDVRFDPESGKASGEVVVDAKSGESGSGARDGRMHKNVLESAKYPEATFAPDRVDGKVEVSGASTVKLHGIFTIHGASHEITVPVAVTSRDGQLTAVIKFELPYVAWGMKDPSNMLLKVNKQVEMQIETTGRLSPNR